MNSKDYYKLLHKKFDGVISEEGLYPAEISEDPLYDTLTNFLIAISLYLGGWEDEAKILVNNIENSHLKNKKGFYNRQATGKEITNRHHSCIDGAAAFFYGISGYQERATKILKQLFDSSLYNADSGLFYRTANELGDIFDDRFIAQSQLWITLALVVNKQHKKAAALLALIEKQCTADNTGLLETMYCATTSIERITLPDDTALFAIANFLIGGKDKAVKILIHLKNSSLFDNERNVFVYKNNKDEERISSYKNFLCQAAYKLCNVEIPPYDIKHEEQFSDSIALGIFAENIYKIKKRTS